jgi:hypothetical protein
LPQCETGGLDFDQRRSSGRLPEAGARLESVMHPPLPSEETLLRAGWTAAGLALLASAALAAEAAGQHLGGLGEICSAGANPHCAWCFGAVSLAIAGLTVSAVAAAPSFSKFRFAPDQGQA